MPKYRVEVDTGWWLDFYTIEAKDEKEAREKAKKEAGKTTVLPPIWEDVEVSHKKDYD